MLEFYFKYHKDKFYNKSKSLADEIMSILKYEGIDVCNTEKNLIPVEYKNLLGTALYIQLNNLYFTIEKKGKRHFLLRRYLSEKKIEPQEGILFADFFCGAGGLSHGLINAGFKPAFVNDLNSDALETYYFNHNLSLSRFFNGNIKNIVANIDKHKAQFKNVKLIAGGPPCQGFSVANRNNFETDPETNAKRFIKDPRNILYKQFINVLGLVRPDFFIIENVRGMMKVEKQIEEDIKRATHLKYYFVPLLLDAQNFNIPQSRIRYFLIGGRDLKFLHNVRSRILSKQKDESDFKLRDALYGLPEIRPNSYKLKSGYDSIRNGYTLRKFSVRQNTYTTKINNGFNSGYVLNHKSRFNNPNDIEIFKKLPEGENSLHKSIAHLNKYTSRNHIFKDKYFKLAGNEVSRTMTSHMKYDCHMYIHPSQSRGLSPREAARIQTFPDDYMFRGALNSWYEQIGNAVPVKMAEVIAKEIIKYYK